MILLFLTAISIVAAADPSYQATWVSRGDEYDHDHTNKGTRADPDYSLVKHVFFDIDGTVKPATYDYVAPENAAAMLEMDRQGIQLYTSTGRCMDQIKDIFHPTGTDMFAGFVTENGAYVVAANGTVVYSALKGVFADVRSQLEAYLAQVYKDDFAHGRVYFQANMVSLTIKPAEGTPKEESAHMVEGFAATVNQWLEEQPEEYLNAVQTFVHWDALDVAPMGVSKAAGIARLGEFLQVQFWGHGLYAGDAENDPFVEVHAMGISVSTHGHATEYAINTVSDLGGAVFWECDDWNFVKCLWSAF